MAKKRLAKSSAKKKVAESSSGKRRAKKKRIAGTAAPQKAIGGAAEGKAAGRMFWLHEWDAWLQRPGGGLDKSRRRLIEDFFARYRSYEEGLAALCRDSGLHPSEWEKLSTSQRWAFLQSMRGQEPLDNPNGDDQSDADKWHGWQSVREYALELDRSESYVRTKVRELVSRGTARRKGLRGDVDIQKSVFQKLRR